MNQVAEELFRRMLETLRDGGDSVVCDALDALADCTGQSRYRHGAAVIRRIMPPGRKRIDDAAALAEIRSLEAKGHPRSKAISITARRHATGSTCTDTLAHRYRERLKDFRREMISPNVVDATNDAMTPKAASTDTPGDTIAALDALEHRLRELDDRRKRLTDAIITVEHTGTRSEDTSVFREQAEALLDGKDFSPLRERPPSVLTRLFTERAAVDQALAVGNRRREQLLHQKAERVFDSNFAEIAELEKRRVRLALDLQHVNRQREELRERIRNAGCGLPLATDGVELLGCGDRDDQVRWALQRLLADRILTRDDLKDPEARD